MEINVAVYQIRRGGVTSWWTLGLGELNRSRTGKSAVKLRQRMIRDLRKALRDAEPSRLEALQMPVGMELKRLRLELNLRGASGGRRRRSGRFPLVVAPRAAAPGQRLQVAYHPARQEAWFPVGAAGGGGDETLEEQAAIFYGNEWADLDDDELQCLESGRDRLRFLAFNASTRTLLDTLRRDDQEAAAAMAGAAARFDLDDVGVNESERAADDRLTAGRPRSPYRERLNRLLGGERATPVLLVGPPGAGKTTLIHRLIADLLEADGFGVHGNLDRCRTVWRISGRRLIAGMSRFGQWEQRAIRLIDEVSVTGRRPDSRRIVLWVEDLHAFGRLGRSADSDRALADVFRAPAARREITIVGECTPGQLQVLEDDAPALAAAFTNLHVAEPSRSETLSMMIAEVREIELDHRPTGGRQAEQLIVEPAVLRSLLEVTATLFSAGALPGTALELLRSLVWQSSDESLRLPTSGRTSVANRGDEPRRLGGGDVLALVAARTGIPRRLLEPSHRLSAAAVEADLESAVLGQPQAIAAARDMVLRLKTGLADPHRPVAVTLFTGPTGTGKTELAKAIAAYLFGSPASGGASQGARQTSRLLRFDMSEYSGPDAAARLAGDRARPQGRLTSALSEQPFCVVLLDEIEKCHPSVLHLLLQVMGDGRLTDAAGNVADFTHAVLIMTSNLGARGDAVGFGDRGDAVAQEVQQAVRAHFPPELFNRIDRVVPFVPLSTGVARAIARKELAQLLRRRGLVDRDIFVSVTESALERVVEEGFDAAYGARSLKRYLDRHLGGLLAEEVAGSPGAEMRNVRIFVRPPGFALEVETLREAQAEAGSRLEPLLALSTDRLRARLPAALAFVETLLEGPELARLSAELGRHLRDFRIGAGGEAEKIYDLDAMRGRLQHFRDRLARQVEAADPDESELLELERFGVMTLKKERRWFDRRRARLLDARAFATAPKQAGKAELLALLAETHFIRRALDGVRDSRRHAVLVELRRLGRRGSDELFSAPADGLLEWLAAAYAEDFGEIEGFAAEVAGDAPGADGTRVVAGAGDGELAAALALHPRQVVLKVAGLSVLDLFAGEAGCHLSRGLAQPAEIVSVAIRSSAAADEPRAVLEARAAGRRRFVETLEAGVEDPGAGETADRPDALGPIVRRYRYDPPAAGGWTRCEVEDYVLCYAGGHRVRSFSEVIALLSLLHRSAEVATADEPAAEEGR